MDHLISVDSIHQLPAVCYHGPGYVYAGAGLSEYPHRMLVDKAKLLSGDFSYWGMAKTSSFLQAWLFFGVLHEFLNVDFEVTDYLVIGEEGRQLITTRKSLPRHLQQWAKESSARHSGRMHGCLQEARHYIQCVADAVARRRCQLPWETLLSMQVLGATLEIALFQRFPEFSTGSGLKPYNFAAKDTWGVSPLLLHRLQEAGWCVNDIERLADTQSLTSMVFATTVVRREAIPREMHHGCSPRACVARNIEETTYFTRHASDGCQCAFVQTPLDDVKAILDRGGVPVLFLHQQPSAQYGVGLEVAEARAGVRYVAFSHVWADGLGNPFANALPGCQLQRLQGLAGDLYVNEGSGGSFASRFFQRTSRSLHNKPIALWIDSLCVPLDRDFRSVAISRMNATYAQAHKVLILDSELLSLSTKGRSERELLLRIFGSSWMRRVWTMQEGALGSQRLYAQFSDGVFDVPAAVHALQKAWKRLSFVADGIDMDVTLFYEQFDWLRKAYSQSYWHDVVPALAVSLNTLRGRATSKDGDAYLCLAGMIGFASQDIKALGHTPVEQRTKMLISNLKYLPKGIIFSPGPKLKEVGYQWACSSFWQSRPFPDNSIAELVPGLGLRVEFQGFLVSPLVLSGKYFLFEAPQQKLWFKATYDESAEPPSAETLRRIGHDEKTMELGIICPTRDVARSGPGSGSSPAVLVSVTRKTLASLTTFFKNSKDTGAIHAQYICLVTLETPREEDWVGGVQVHSTHSGRARRPNIRGGLEGIAYIPQIWYIS